MFNKFKAKKWRIGGSYVVTIPQAYAKQMHNGVYEFIIKEVEE